MTSSAAAERIQLAELCSSKDWSKAIRVLNTLIKQSCVVQDLCNRAFCYSQLELHKHAIKDCDSALQLDPNVLQAYIVKGHALSSLGRKEEALAIWKQGYEHGIFHSADLKQLLELADLLRGAKGNVSVFSSGQNNTIQSDGVSIPANGCVQSNECSGVSDMHVKENGKMEPINKSNDNLEVDQKLQMGPSLSANEKFDHQSHKNNKSYQAETDGANRGKSDFSDSSESSTGSCSVNGESSDLSDIFDHLCLAGVRDELMEEVKNKLSMAKISKKKSINVDFRLSRGISHVNDGNYDHAISIFNKILQEEPDYSEALIGRGTAYAFQRELHAAIADFTKAIESDPSAGEAWKRRGQARAALGESAEAISDLTKALEFEPNSADVLHERGIVNFKFKDYKAAVEDLSACVEIESDNKSAYTYLGLALSSVGEYKKAEEAHMKAIQIDRHFLEAWTHLAQFYQDLADSEKALQCLHEILQIDGRFAKAYHLRGLLLHNMGEHRNAIKELSAGLTIESSNIECLYLRASCYHAIGEFKDAVKDYDASLDVELDSVDKFVLQCLAFYQKEIALYTASKFNTEFAWFDLDGDIDPLFKEYWCKKLHPKNVCEKVYRQPPLRDSLRKGKLKKQEFSLTKQKAALLQAADSIGSKIQYHCPGFLRNKRQYRMAGLAAIEIAQKVVKVWRSLQNEWKRSIKGTSRNGKKTRRRERLNPGCHNRGGAGCSSTSSFLETSTTYSESEDRSSGRPTMVWNGVYSLAVKWRQISEPCDPVFWINKLGEEFNSGFGSHTPLMLGQARNVRYFPNIQRALNVAKDVIKDNKFVRGKDSLIYLHEKAKIQGIMSAESYSDLYRIVGEDFWLTTWCYSTAFEGKRLEGTRINISKSGENGYDFAIRTPCKPSRWKEFDVEMTSAWEALCDAYCGENYGSTELNALDNLKDAILRMTYYWYNFMPLSRGTAVVGLVVMLGLLLAANMEFTGSIPEGIQVDWEAILVSDPDSFISSIKSWLYPSIKVNTSWKGYPDVSSTFETTGLVVAALSNYFD